MTDILDSQTIKPKTKISVAELKNSASFEQKIEKKIEDSIAQKLTQKIEDKITTKLLGSDSDAHLKSPTVQSNTSNRQIKV